MNRTSTYCENMLTDRKEHHLPRAASMAAQGARLPLSSSCVQGVATSMSAAAWKGRALAVGALIGCACSSTGCGFVASHVFPSSDALSAAASTTGRATKSGMVAEGRTVQVAAERKFVASVPTPALITSKSARALPAPAFGLTPEVQRELDRFLTSDRATVQQVLERRSSHNEMLEKVFEGEGVPFELLSVAAVESRYDPKAVSPAGARGMWQFMGPTARSYGLKVSGKLDERTDPLRSTVAAAKHLRDLFLSYNDWHLALAAYNAGIGTINKLVSRRGSMDFWQLSREGKFSGETARFVPRVIALTMIVKDPDMYGFSDIGTVG